MLLFFAFLFAIAGGESGIVAGVLIAFYYFTHSCSSECTREHQE